MIPLGRVKFRAVEQGYPRFSVQEIGLRSIVSMGPDDSALWSPQYCLCPETQMQKKPAISCIDIAGFDTIYSPEGI